MSNLITAENLGAALTGFAISLAAALKPNQPNRVLADLANELSDFARQAPDTPAGEAMEHAAQFLKASEPEEPHEKSASVFTVDGGLELAISTTGYADDEIRLSLKHILYNGLEAYSPWKEGGGGFDIWAEPRGEEAAQVRLLQRLIRTYEEWEREQSANPDPNIDPNKSQNSAEASR